MAKRFSDSNKWSKPFLRSLKAPYKLLWLYILDECDHAGIWQVDFATAQIRIGEKLNPADAVNYFGDKIIQVDNNEKWFIVDFIEFQYGDLQDNNKVHASVIKILSRFGLWDFEKKAIIKGLTSPLQGAKDKEKDMDKEKDKQAPKKPIVHKHPFSESEFYDISVFTAMLESSPEPYCKVDPQYYYESAKNGSEAKGYKYLDWAAAIKNWIRNDEKKGQIRRKPIVNNMSNANPQHLTGIIQ